MRAIRITKSQRTTLEHLASLDWDSKVIRKDLSDLLRKMVEADTDDVPVHIGLLESALITNSNNKCIGIDSFGWARATRQARLVGLGDGNVGDMVVMGKWLSCQQWLPAQSLTIIDVLNKWVTWWPKAQAAIKPVLKKGLNEPITGPNPGVKDVKVKAATTGQGFR